MHIEIRAYGVTARLLGSEQLRLELPDGSTVREALAQLAAQATDGSSTLDRCACALGDAIVPRGTVLADGAVLALLPPVAGG